MLQQICCERIIWSPSFLFHLSFYKITHSCIFISINKYKYICMYVNGCSLGSTREWAALSWTNFSLKLCGSRNIPLSFKEYLEGGLYGAHLHTSFKSQLSVLMLTTLMKEAHLIPLYVLVFILLFSCIFCCFVWVNKLPVCLCSYLWSNASALCSMDKKYWEMLFFWVT